MNSLSLCTPALRLAREIDRYGFQFNKVCRCARKGELIVCLNFHHWHQIEIVLTYLLSKLQQTTAKLQQTNSRCNKTTVSSAVTGTQVNFPLILGISRTPRRETCTSLFTNNMDFHKKSVT